MDVPLVPDSIWSVFSWSPPYQQFVFRDTFDGFYATLGLTCHFNFCFLLGSILVSLNRTYQIDSDFLPQFLFCIERFIPLIIIYQVFEIKYFQTEPIYLLYHVPFTSFVINNLFICVVNMSANVQPICMQYVKFSLRANRKAIEFYGKEKMLVYETFL